MQTVLAQADLFICCGWSGEYVFRMGWTDAEDLWCWLHFSENGNGRSSSAAGDLKAIWCCSQTPKPLADYDITIFLMYRSNICSLFNYNRWRVHNMVLQFMNKMFRYILEKKNSLLKKTVTRSPREQQGQYICKNKNVSLTNDCYTINTIN